MAGIYTPYNKTVADMTADMQESVWGEKDLGDLERTVQKFRAMVVETIYEHRDCGLYTITYQVLDYMVNYIQKFETLSVLDSRTYWHFNVHVN